MKPRGFEVAQGKLVRSPSKSQTRAAGREVRGASRERSVSPTRDKGKRQSQMKDAQNKEKEKDKEGGSRPIMLSSFRRTNSFAPASQKNGSGSGLGASQVFKRTTTLTDLPGSFLSAQVVQPRTPPAAADDEEDADEPAISPSAQQKGKQRADLSSESASMLFQGLRFRMRGDANCEAVRSALSEHGGVCISDDDDHSESADFIIVRLVR